nr:hypothetical protein Iba_chr06dCG1910 [Ipomoea batatas]GMD09991.1 hypothetical protein Iba_chr06eCG1950 [Ipomoea batatas]
MDSTTTIIRSLFNSSGSTPSLQANEKTTNPNSPPWERRNPILMLSCRVSPTRGPIAVIISVLITIRPARSERTFGHSRKNTSVSIEVPVVTKNSPRSNPLNGLISASI